MLFSCNPIGQLFLGGLCYSSPTVTDSSGHYITVRTVRPFKRFKVALVLIARTGRPNLNANRSIQAFFGVFDVIFQEITRLSFKACIKDSQGMSKSHDPVTVNYAIVGGTLLLYLLILKFKDLSLILVRPAIKEFGRWVKRRIEEMNSNKN